MSHGEKSADTSTCQGYFSAYGIESGDGHDGKGLAESAVDLMEASCFRSRRAVKEREPADGGAPNGASLTALRLRKFWLP